MSECLCIDVDGEPVKFQLERGTVVTAELRDHLVAIARAARAACAPHDFTPIQPMHPDSLVRLHCSHCGRKRERCLGEELKKREGEPR